MWLVLQYLAAWYAKHSHYWKKFWWQDVDERTSSLVWMTARKLVWLDRNGVGKSTLFGILTEKILIIRARLFFGAAYSCDRSGTSQFVEQTVMSWWTSEYSKLKIIDEYPLAMGDNMRKIIRKPWSDLIKKFYQVEEKIERASNFQLDGYGDRRISSLSGVGQKRLVEIVKVCTRAHLARLTNRPTTWIMWRNSSLSIGWLPAIKRCW